MQVFDPPFMEGAVWTYEEGLLRRWSLRKGVRDVRTKHKKVFSRGNSVKQAGASLFHTVRVSFSKDEYFTGTCRSVAYASCFLPPVNRFNIVGPDE